MRQLLPKQLGIAAHEEFPHAELSPMIHCGDPTARGLMFSISLLTRLALYLQNDIDAICQFYDEVRFIYMRIAIKIIWNVEFQMVVSGIAKD